MTARTAAETTTPASPTAPPSAEDEYREHTIAERVAIAKAGGRLGAAAARLLVTQWRAALTEVASAGKEMDREIQREITRIATRYNVRIARAQRAADQYAAGIEAVKETYPDLLTGVEGN